VEGLKFSLPSGSGTKGLATALATFGIIGVGASELVAYPYWCLEKGYARYTGLRTDDEAWAVRARGWMRVMHIDAFVSMLLYTIATLAFFIMGVAVLHRKGLDPDKMRMVSTLAESYVPVFGAYAKWLFLIGAFAVLYSTFLVALASHARMYSDALKVWGIMDPHDRTKHERAVSLFGAVLPLVCLTTYWAGINPVRAVLFSGTMQALMLPMLAFAALYFRRYRTDPRLAPRRSWDALLILSSLGLLVAGLWGAYAEIAKYIGD
jgi:Mn2+/Fe2+ NRAMP family transporter